MYSPRPSCTAHCSVRTGVVGLSLSYLFGKAEEAARAAKSGSRLSKEEQPEGAKGVPQKYTIKLSMLELYNEQLQVRLEFDALRMLSRVGERAWQE